VAIGRNEPCPCGSGKKYKKCCCGQSQGFGESNSNEDVFGSLEDLLAETEFSSLEEAQAKIDEYSNARNNFPVEDFHGLSAAQMHSFLYQPFDCPHLVKFADTITSEVSAPVFNLFSLLIDAIGEGGLKATAKGNLPTKFCKAAALAYQGEYKYRRSYVSSRTETDFYDLHLLRLLAELCGMVRKYKGQFIIGTKYRKALATHGPAGLFPELLKRYLGEFNWAYGDRYDEVFFIQRSFLFSLYLLNKYGNESRPQKFYQDQFIRAFPAIVSEVQDDKYGSGEEQIRRMYFLRTFERCFSYFGLAELKIDPKGHSFGMLEVKKLPLLDQVVTFMV
jgi:hypothetical protein